MNTVRKLAARRPRTTTTLCNYVTGDNYKCGNIFPASL